MAVFLIFAGVLSSGCNERPNETTDSISGRVMMEGKPVPRATVCVVGEDKSEVSAQTTLEGKYLLAGPPIGKLQFKVTGSPSRVSGIPHVPPRYSKLDNGLTFEYTGGRQTFEIELTP
jgi:hypothetical protein